MNRKDTFIEWLRGIILQNPAEPPEAAWQEISDSLDLEDSWEAIGEELELNAVWEKVDFRLGRYEHLLRFEKISYGFSLTAMVLLLLPILFMPSWQESGKRPLAKEQGSAGRYEPAYAAVEKETDDSVNILPDPEAGTVLAKNRPGTIQKQSGVQTVKQQDKAVNQDSKDKPAGHMPQAGWMAAEDKAVAIQPMAGIAPRPQKIIALNRTGMQAVSPLEPVWDEVYDINIPIMAEQTLTGKNPYEAYPAVYLGIGTAVKLTSLLSRKTLHAMERSSLLRSAPDWQQDIFILYGHRLADRLFLQADIFLQNKAGQQYYEYREGTYTSFRDHLNYRSAALSLSWIRKQVSIGRIPVYARWTAGVYGGTLRSAEENSILGSYNRREEYVRFHAGLQAGYEYDLLLTPQLMLSYGVFGRSDIMNIYAGTELIPSSFRNTRVISADFRLTFKYLIQK